MPDFGVVPGDWMATLLSHEGEVKIPCYYSLSVVCLSEYKEIRTGKSEES